MVWCISARLIISMGMYWEFNIQPRVVVGAKRNQNVVLCTSKKERKKRYFVLDS